MPRFGKKMQFGSMFNRTAHAGPRRFVVIGGVAVAALGLVAFVAFSGGSQIPTQSLTARMPHVDPLPGGVNSSPNQDKLALQTDQEQADQAGQRRASYTPPIPASQAVQAPAMAPWVPRPEPVAAKPLDLNAGLRVVSPSSQEVAPEDRDAPNTMVQPVAQVQQVAVDVNQQQAYDAYVKKLLRGWNGRPPLTDVTIQPGTTGGEGNGSSEGSPFGTNSSGREQSASSNGSNQGRRGRLIMPAGRGVYAHTVLAADSDNPGSIVLQADSGPLAGDRMIGTFAKAGGSNMPSDRLVVRVVTVEHQGHSISVDALVTAPDTMETNVASSVDEHYASRFLLPAAAAFVQGLGSALATTSNTVGVLSPLGGTSYATQLNFPQQLGVGAGVAAGQVASTLQQQAPRGPTVHLAANSNVGVMFLADMTTDGNY